MLGVPKKIQFDVAEICRRQLLENVDRTDLVLASGKLVLQKDWLQESNPQPLGPKPTVSNTEPPRPVQLDGIFYHNSFFRPAKEKSSRENS